MSGNFLQVIFQTFFTSCNFTGANCYRKISVKLQESHHFKKSHFLSKYRHPVIFASPLVCQNTGILFSLPSPFVKIQKFCHIQNPFSVILESCYFHNLHVTVFRDQIFKQSTCTFSFYLNLKITISIELFLCIFHDRSTIVELNRHACYMCYVLFDFCMFCWIRKWPRNNITDLRIRQNMQISNST